MPTLDEWIYQQVAPYFVPGEAPLAVALTRNAVSLGVAMVSGGPRGIHNDAHYQYTALTSEHLFFVSTTAQMGMTGTITGDQENRGVQVFELLELVGVRFEKAGAWDTVVFVHRDGRELRQTVIGDPATSSQTIFVEPHAHGLARALADGSLRTPERLARMAQLDARLAAERQAAAAQAAINQAQADARMVQFNNAEDERIKRTIDKQPETPYRTSIAMVVIGAVMMLAVAYNAFSAVSAALSMAEFGRTAASTPNSMTRNHATDRMKEYAGDAATSGVFAFASLVLAAGAGGGAFYFRKQFKKGNAELRAKYGLPPA